ncbi:MAG: serine/threonine protein kinase [Labilithrix sp.]|nr:serine/threonine protein kinase [Labilithrix sp.]
MRAMGEDEAAAESTADTTIREPSDATTRDRTARTEVVHREEAARAAAFGRGVATFAFLGLIVGAVRDVPLRSRILTMAATGILFVSGAGVWWRSRNVDHYSIRTFRLFGSACALSSMILIYTLGTFSPIVVIVVLGLSFFVHGRDRTFIFPFSLTVIGGYALLALLVTAGVLPDDGVWRTPATQQRLSMTVIVSAAMITQFVLARSNHRALLDAIARAQEAMKVAQTREAQLHEVRENLDAALRGGNAGRLTGTLLGDWRAGEVVGRGAMGEVYAAQSTEGERTAAIKVLRTPDDEVIAKRFAREADIARRVRGPNLVDVFDSGRAADGSIYIVMELLAGQDLAAILRERPQLSLEEVVVLVEETARGLAVLHAAGVVHRDLKPQNLFRAVGRPPVWKILDYGVSKLVGAGTMTENDLVGTPGYMSPEQAEGQEIDLRSDVFSLGAVAYRALTGRRPFSGPDTPQILYQVVHGTPTRPREIVPSLPKEVETVLAIALAKRPGDRFGTAMDLASALRAGAQGSPPSIPRLAAAKAGRAWRAEVTTLTMPRAERGSSRRAAAKRRSFPDA